MERSSKVGSEVISQHYISKYVVYLYTNEAFRISFFHRLHLSQKAIIGAYTHRLAYAIYTWIQEDLFSFTTLPGKMNSRLIPNA